MAEMTQGALEAEMKEIFVPYRGFFNRNGVNVIITTMQNIQSFYGLHNLMVDGMIQSSRCCQQVEVSEVVLEEADVSKAILGYITANKIQSIALGGASRNAFTKY